jgi:hypothetical protein
MKLALLAVCVGASLAAPGIAAAETPQGKLAGFAGGPSFFLSISVPIMDGGTSDVGLGNDLSGNCNGDSGGIFSNFSINFIVCAHFVQHSGCCNAGSPKMRFAYQTAIAGWTVVRVTDVGGSGDTVAIGTTTSLADAQAWVNTGANGSGHPSTAWTFQTLTSGNLTITP